MKCSLGISNFLEEICSLSCSVVFLYFFALIAKEGFLISSCYSLEPAFRWEYLSFSPLPLASLLFSAISKASSDSHFAFLRFFFGDGFDHHLLYNARENAKNSMTGLGSDMTDPRGLGEPWNCWPWGRHCQ